MDPSRIEHIWQTLWRSQFFRGGHDFHQRTTPAYAIQLARELAPIRPFFIEDPVRAENPAQFAHLGQHIWGRSPPASRSPARPFGRSVGRSS